MATEDDKCERERRRNVGGDVGKLLAETVMSASPWRRAFGLRTPPSSPPDSSGTVRLRRTTSLQGDAVAVDHDMATDCATGLPRRHGKGPTPSYRRRLAIGGEGDITDPRLVMEASSSMILEVRPYIGDYNQTRYVFFCSQH